MDKKEIIKQYKHDYYLKNKEKIQQNQREYYLKNKEKFKEINKNWVKNNKSKSNEIKNKWNKKNRPYFYQYQKDWRNKNPNKVLEYSKNQFERHNHDMSYFQYKITLSSWSKVIKTRDDNQCQVCGSTTNLHAHHIFPKSSYSGLEFNLNNGVTMCSQHHKELHDLNGWK